MSLRNMGECCLVLPLKFGVGLIAMGTFANSLICALAMVSQDIRFQPNGYNPDFYHLPSIIGVFGIGLGFVGLLGVYDEKPNWVQAFCYFMYAHWIGLLVAMLADVSLLRRCDTWLVDEPDSLNVAMNQLAKNGVCSFARKAYIVGGVLDLAAWAYMTLKVRHFAQTLSCSLPYDIVFGGGSRMEETWLKYQVKDPRPDIYHAENLKKQRMGEKAREAEERHTQEYYGTMETGHGRYGPDGMEILAEPDIPMDVPIVADGPVDMGGFAHVTLDGREMRSP